ncbi:Uncharacterised protein [Chlamydia trachomatis]|nr:Uncharacterised protein [Chlamydia trachomatis]
MLYICICSNLCKSGDCTLHTPQHQARLRFKKRTRISQSTVNWWSCKREEHARLVSRLQNSSSCAANFLRNCANPLYKRVNIAITRQVCWNKPQLCAHLSVFAIRFLRPRLNARLETVRSCDNRSSTLKQARYYASSNRIRSNACNYCNFSCKTSCLSSIGVVLRKFSARIANNTIKYCCKIV